jgi:hypothetical protein
MAEQMVRIDRLIARVAFVSRVRALPCVSRRDRRRRRARISRAWQHRQRDPNRATSCVSFDRNRAYKPSGARYVSDAIECISF